MSADDVGCMIQVQVQSNDSSATGLAIGQFGPVELDIQTRLTLEQILDHGGSQFAVASIPKKAADSESETANEE